MTGEDETNFDESGKHYFCSRRLDGKGLREPKVGDHCQLTGKFRGADRSMFNVNVEKVTFFPMIFDNPSIYSCHLLFKTFIKRGRVFFNWLCFRKLKNTQ